MSETRRLFDPFLSKEVEISSKLVDRLRGRYANGPTMPNGEPEFGWNEYPTVPIQKEAADRIEALTAHIAAIRPQVNVEAWRPIDSAPKDGTRFIATQSGTNTTTWIVSSDEDGHLFSHAPWHRGGAKGVTLWHPLPLAATPAPPPQTSDPANVIALGYGKFGLDSGTYQGVPAVFIEPRSDQGVIGDLTPDAFENLNSVTPGSTAITFANREGAEVLIERINRAVPPPQTSGSVPDDIALAADAYGNACAYEERDSVACSDARAHLDALILAHVALRVDYENSLKETGKLLRRIDVAINGESVPAKEVFGSKLLEQITELVALRTSTPPSAAVIPEGWRMVSVELVKALDDFLYSSFNTGRKGRGWELGGERAYLVDASLYDFLAKASAASPTPPAITLENIVAMLTSEEKLEEAFDAYGTSIGGKNWTMEAGESGPIREGIRAALRVAAEAVLKLGAR